MSATLTVDRKKYVRLANRIVVKAIESEEEYDRMVAAVEQLMNKGEEPSSRRNGTVGNYWLFWCRPMTTAPLAATCAFLMRCWDYLMENQRPDNQGPAANLATRGRVRGLER